MKADLVVRRRLAREQALEAAEREVVAAAVEWRLAWRGESADGIQLGALSARLDAAVDALLKLREEE